MNLLLVIVSGIISVFTIAYSETSVKVIYKILIKDGRRNFGEL